MTPQAEAKPAEAVWLSLLRGHAAARRLLDAGLRNSCGLTAVEYEALLLLSRADESALRRVDLADGLGLTPSGVTRLLDGLEQEGLVAKRSCSADARVTYAVLTEAGAATLEQASCAHGVSVRTLFEERFTCEELQTLAELLDRLPAAGDGDEAVAA